VLGFAFRGVPRISAQGPLLSSEQLLRTSSQFQPPPASAAVLFYDCEVEDDYTFFKAGKSLARSFFFFSLFPHLRELKKRSFIGSPFPVYGPSAAASISYPVMRLRFLQQRTPAVTHTPPLRVCRGFTIPPPGRLRRPPGSFSIPLLHRRRKSPTQRVSASAVQPIPS